MKLVMTLLVRDEEDIVAANIDYHLSRGVDFVIATDNISRDRTTAILREYERAGVLRYIFEPAGDISQDLWVTRMARLAATEHAADWVFHVDADEFWWPERDESLKAPLARVDAALDGIYVQRNNFVPTVSLTHAEPFYRALQYRERHSLNVLGKPLPGKVANRANPRLFIEAGNHTFNVDGRAPRIADCSDILVFHFPMRSIAQYRSKVTNGGSSIARNTRFGPEFYDTWRMLYDLERAGKLEAFYEQQVVDAASLRRLLDAGDLIHDARLYRYLEDLGARRAAPGAAHAARA